MSKHNKLKILWFVNTPSLAASKFGISALPSGSWISGAELEMRKRKDITLAVAFIMPGEKTGRFLYNNSTYYSVHQKYTNSKIGGFWNRIMQTVDLCRMNDLLWVVDDFKPDLIHVWGSERPFGLVANLTKTPVVLRIQGIVQAWLGHIYRDNTFLLNICFLKFRIAYQRISVREKEIFKIIKYYIGQTDWDEDMISILSPKSKYFRISSVVREEFFKNKWHRKHNSRLFILSIMRPSPYKGFEEVLKVAKIMKEAKIDFIWKIVGTAQDSKLIKIIEIVYRDSFFRNNICFLGILSEKKLVKEFINSDIYVHPSHIENDCNSIIEAMVLGMPVISNFVGGTSSLLESGVTGLFVQDGDVPAMAAKIIELKNNPQKAKLLGRRARQVALAKFDTVASTNRLVRVYKKILKFEKQQGKKVRRRSMH